ncbi:MAG: hypothetical protein SFZ03_01640 [Candidatus Melainabacteria bacterium]|nr:hypothetical protein [Candidatus Melainabacteria bacterium]
MLPIGWFNQRLWDGAVPAPGHQQPLLAQRWGGIAPSALGIGLPLPPKKDDWQRQGGLETLRFAADPLYPMSPVPTPIPPNARPNKPEAAWSTAETENYLIKTLNHMDLKQRNRTLRYLIGQPPLSSSEAMRQVARHLYFEDSISGDTQDGRNWNRVWSMRLLHRWLEASPPSYEACEALTRNFRELSGFNAKVTLYGAHVLANAYNRLSETDQARIRTMMRESIMSTTSAERGRYVATEMLSQYGTLDDVAALWCRMLRPETTNGNLANNYIGKMSGHAIGAIVWRLNGPQRAVTLNQEASQAFQRQSEKPADVEAQARSYIYKGLAATLPDAPFRLQTLTDAQRLAWLNAMFTVYERFPDFQTPGTEGKNRYGQAFATLIEGLDDTNARDQALNRYLKLVQSHISDKGLLVNLFWLATEGRIARHDLESQLVNKHFEPKQLTALDNLKLTIEETLQEAEPDRPLSLNIFARMAEDKIPPSSYRPTKQPELSPTDFRLFPAHLTMSQEAAYRSYIIDPLSVNIPPSPYETSPIHWQSPQIPETALLKPTGRDVSRTDIDQLGFDFPALPKENLFWRGLKKTPVPNNAMVILQQTFPNSEAVSKLTQRWLEQRNPAAYRLLTVLVPSSLEASKGFWEGLTQFVSLHSEVLPASVNRAKLLYLTQEAFKPLPEANLHWPWPAFNSAIRHFNTALRPEPEWNGVLFSVLLQNLQPLTTSGMRAPILNALSEMAEAVGVPQSLERANPYGVSCWIDSLGEQIMGATTQPISKTNLWLDLVASSNDPKWFGPASRSLYDYYLRVRDNSYADETFLVRHLSKPYFINQAMATEDEALRRNYSEMVDWYRIHEAVLPMVETAAKANLRKQSELVEALLRLGPYARNVLTETLTQNPEALSAAGSAFARRLLPMLETPNKFLDANPGIQRALLPDFLKPGYLPDNPPDNMLASTALSEQPSQGRGAANLIALPWQGLRQRLQSPAEMPVQEGSSVETLPNPSATQPAQGNAPASVFSLQGLLNRINTPAPEGQDPYLFQIRRSVETLANVPPGDTRYQAALNTLVFNAESYRQRILVRGSGIRAQSEEKNETVAGVLRLLTSVNGVADQLQVLRVVKALAGSESVPLLLNRLETEDNTTVIVALLDAISAFSTEDVIERVSRWSRSKAYQFNPVRYPAWEPVWPALVEMARSVGDSRPLLPMLNVANLPPEIRLDLILALGETYAEGSGPTRFLLETLQRPEGTREERTACLQSLALVSLDSRYSAAVAETVLALLTQPNSNAQELELGLAVLENLPEPVIQNRETLLAAQTLARRYPSYRNALSALMLRPNQ